MHARRAGRVRRPSRSGQWRALGRTRGCKTRAVTQAQRRESEEGGASSDPATRESVKPESEPTIAMPRKNRRARPAGCSLSQQSTPPNRPMSLGPLRRVARRKQRGNNGRPARGATERLEQLQGHVLALRHGASRFGGARFLDVRLVSARSTRHVAPSLRANPRATRIRLLRRRHLQSTRGGGAHPRGDGAREAAPCRSGCSRPIPAAPSAAEQCTRAAPLRAAALRPSGLRPS